MIENSTVLSAALTVVSVLSLSLLFILCLRCRKKSSGLKKSRERTTCHRGQNFYPETIHEEHQVYNPQTFQRGGSMFVVTQSKVVTRTNQMAKVSENGDDYEEIDPDGPDQSNYENITDSHTGFPESEYIAPLPIPVYENEQTDPEKTDVYANEPKEDDEDDYENSEFLQNQEDDEPDYVNAPDETRKHPNCT